jgi:hypothetical protein
MANDSESGARHRLEDFRSWLEHNKTWSAFEKCPCRRFGNAAPGKGRMMIEHRLNGSFSNGFGHAVPTEIVLASQPRPTNRLHPMRMPARKFVENYCFNPYGNVLQVGVSGGANNA